MQRSFADVEIADVPGTRVPQLRPDMWQPQRDYATPLWDLAGRGAPPAGGMPFYVPKFTSSVSVRSSALRSHSAGMSASSPANACSSPLKWAAKARS